MQIKCFMLAGLMASCHAVSLKAAARDFLDGDVLESGINRLVQLECGDLALMHPNETEADLMSQVESEIEANLNIGDQITL